MRRARRGGQDASRFGRRGPIYFLIGTSEVPRQLRTSFNFRTIVEAASKC